MMVWSIEKMSWELLMKESSPPPLPLNKLLICSKDLKKCPTEDSPVSFGPKECSLDMMKITIIYSQNLNSWLFWIPPDSTLNYLFWLTVSPCPLKNKLKKSPCIDSEDPLTNKIIWSNSSKNHPNPTKKWENTNPTWDTDPETTWDLTLELIPSKKIPLSKTPQETLFTESSIHLLNKNKDIKISLNSSNTHGSSNLWISLEKEKLTINTSGKETKMMFHPFPWMLPKNKFFKKSEIGSEDKPECPLILSNGSSGSDTRESSTG